MKVGDREVLVGTKTEEDLEKFREALAGVLLAVSDWKLQDDLGILDELDSGWGPVSYLGSWEVFQGLDEEKRKAAIEAIVDVKKIEKVSRGYRALLKVHADISDFQNFADDLDDLAHAIALAASKTPGIRYVRALFEYTIGVDLEPVGRTTKVRITRKGPKLNVKVTHQGPEYAGGPKETWRNEWEVEIEEGT